MTDHLTRIRLRQRLAKVATPQAGPMTEAEAEKSLVQDRQRAREAGCQVYVRQAGPVGITSAQAASVAQRLIAKYKTEERIRDREW